MLLKSSTGSEVGVKIPQKGLMDWRTPLGWCIQPLISWHTATVANLQIDLISCTVRAMKHQTRTSPFQATTSMLISLLKSKGHDKNELHFQSFKNCSQKHKLANMRPRFRERNITKKQTRTDSNFNLLAILEGISSEFLTTHFFLAASPALVYRKETTSVNKASEDPQLVKMSICLTTEWTK